jgi:hypothetical protein
MTSDCLELDVRDFLRAHVTTLGDLKVLLALVGCGPRWWDAQAMGAITGLDPATARVCLDGFAAKNLLDIRLRDTVRYQLRAGTRELERSLDTFSAAYRKSPALVISWAAADMCRSHDAD